MSLEIWAARWGVSAEALAELPTAMWGDAVGTPTAGAPGTEAGVVSQLRLRAPHCDALLWRNNRGAAVGDGGRLLRYGIANDSAKMGQRWRSSDLIGIASIQVRPSMVGRKIGVFVAMECKRPEWHYLGTEHEQGQRNFLGLIDRYGGAAAFACSDKALDAALLRVGSRA